MKILIFARLRDELGTGQLTLDIELPTSLASLRSTLIETYPQHAEVLKTGNALFAINQELSQSDDEQVQADDEVALFPPMTGG